MTKNCVFCKIIKKEIPSTIIYETKSTLSFLDLNPVNPGHALVIPKKHSKNHLEMSDNQVKDLAVVVKKIAIAVKKAVKANGLNINTNIEKAANQAVFHTHIHIVPRFNNDGIRPPVSKTNLKPSSHKKYKKGEIEETAEKIKTLLK